MGSFFSVEKYLLQMIIKGKEKSLVQSVSDKEGGKVGEVGSLIRTSLQYRS